ncbi:conserved protein of unknown function [Burkholderia multivorans]
MSRPSPCVPWHVVQACIFSSIDEGIGAWFAEANAAPAHNAQNSNRIERTTALRCTTDLVVKRVFKMLH